MSCKRRIPFKPPGGSEEATGKEGKERGERGGEWEVTKSETEYECETVASVTLS